MQTAQAFANAVERGIGGGKIMILAGAGCRGSRDELLQLAQTLNAPIAGTLRATDVIEEEINT